MSGPTQPDNARILLRAVEEMDKLALRFRRRLRDRAIELSQEGGQLESIGPDAVARALPLVCEEFLAENKTGSDDERDADGRRPHAA